MSILEFDIININALVPQHCLSSTNMSYNLISNKAAYRMIRLDNPNDLFTESSWLTTSMQAHEKMLMKERRNDPSIIFGIHWILSTSRFQWG